MARRKITFGDWARGTLASIQNGSIMNPIVTQKFVNAAHDERILLEKRRNFGSGTSFGDRNWEPPLHATTYDGSPVTVSFGRGQRAGETLVARGHVTANEFYAKAVPGQGHDHYLADGSMAPRKDRGMWP